MRDVLKLLARLIRLPLAALPLSNPDDMIPEQKQPDKGIAYFMLFQYPNLPKQTLTEWFTAQGHPPEKTFAGGGGGGGYARERIFYEGYGYGLGGKAADGAALGMGSGGGSTGYTVFQNDWLRIGPLVGIGGGGIGITPPRDETAESPPNNAKSVAILMSQVEVGLGIDFLLPVPKINLMIGLRVGYRFVKGHQEAAPNLSGPFLRVMTGIKRN